MLSRLSQFLSVLVAVVVMNPISSAVNIAVEEHYKKACRALGNVHPLGGVTAITALDTTLDGHEDFNHDSDESIVRSSSMGFALRKTFFGLAASDLQSVVGRHEAFFRTSLGMSLIHGWMMSHFPETVTPYYIGNYFSFGKFFQGMASSMASDTKSMDMVIAGSSVSLLERRRGASVVSRASGNALVDFLRQACARGVTSVEKNEDARWGYYHHMLYLPYAIEQVHSCRKAFVIDALSAGMQQNYRDLIVHAVDGVSKYRYTQGFVTACNSLGAGMDGVDKSRVIHAVTKVPEDKYQFFTDTCKGISVGMNLYDQSQIAHSLAEISIDKYTPAFVTTCRGLLVCVSGKKHQIINGVAEVSADKYTPAFITTCNRLSIGMDGLKKLWVIRAIAMVFSGKYQAFIDTFTSLNTEMDKHTVYLIGVLADMPADNYNPEFVANCKHLSAGKKEADKFAIIRNYAKTLGSRL